MQWSSVAGQRRDGDSLLHFLTRLLHARREAPELGWGTSTLLENDPAALLAHRSDWQGSTVITVHNLWDYLVPFFHEPAFQQIVQSAGASDMLLQRAIPDYGHCSRPAIQAAIVQSFLDLVTWVSTGEKPAS